MPMARPISQSNLDKRFQANAHAKSFLEDQLKQLKLRLEEAEKALLAFAEKEQIVANHGEKSSVAESNLAAANVALGALIAERIKNEQLWRQAQNASGINVPQILSNKAIEELRSRRGQLAAEYQEKSETFRADYPAMTQLSNKIKEIDHQIGVEVNNIKSSLKAAYNASLSQENEMKERTEKLRSECLICKSEAFNIICSNTRWTRLARSTRVCCSVTRRWTSPAASARIMCSLSRSAQLGALSSPNRPKALLISLALGLLVGAAGGLFSSSSTTSFICRSTRNGRRD